MAKQIAQTDIDEVGRLAAKALRLEEAIAMAETVKTSRRHIVAKTLRVADFDIVTAIQALATVGIQVIRVKNRLYVLGEMDPTNITRTAFVEHTVDWSKDSHEQT